MAGNESKLGILGLGAYVPERVMTNDEWAEHVDTSDEWIQQRTGIQQRRFVDFTTSRRFFTEWEASDDK